MSNDITTDLLSLTAVWVDNGLFCDFARSVAPAFGKLLYFSPWQCAFPTSNTLLVGDGFDEMGRVTWLFDAIERADLVIMPDVNFGDLAVHLRKLGIPVWGAGRGEMMELNRARFKKLLKDQGQPVGGYELIEGIDSLRSYLRSHPDVFVKISLVRGDFETFHSLRYDLIEPKLDEIEWKLGAKKHIARFVVEDAINDAVEFGYDGFSIDGKFPVRSFSGCEMKDLGFVGKVMEYADLPEYMQTANASVAPTMADANYRGWYSNELRITKDRTAYQIDPCTRLPSPPNEIAQEIFSNWPEIIWRGAHGLMTEPKTVKPFGVCAMIHCAYATRNWVPIRFPKEVAQWVKLRNHCIIDGVDYFVPQPASDLPEIGAVVGIGDTMEEAIAHLEDNAAQVEGYGLEIKMESVQDGLEEIEKAREVGIPI